MNWMSMSCLRGLTTGGPFGKELVRAMSSMKDVRAWGEVTMHTPHAWDDVRAEVTRRWNKRMYRMWKEKVRSVNDATGMRECIVHMLRRVSLDGRARHQLVETMIHQACTTQGRFSRWMLMHGRDDGGEGSKGALLEDMASDVPTLIPDHILRTLLLSKGIKHCYIENSVQHMNSLHECVAASKSPTHALRALMHWVSDCPLPLEEDYVSEAIAGIHPASLLALQREEARTHSDLVRRMQDTHTAATMYREAGDLLLRYYEGTLLTKSAAIRISARLRTNQDLGCKPPKLPIVPSLLSPADRSLMIPLVTHILSPP